MASSVDSLRIQTAEPSRVHLESREGQQRLVPNSDLKVSSTELRGGDPNPEKRDGNTGWRAQESAYSRAGASWSRGQDGDWSRFSGGSGRRGGAPIRGAVEIDGQAVQTGPVQTAAKPGETGWDRMARVYSDAATHEESIRDRVGGSGLGIADRSPRQAPTRTPIARVG